MKDLKNFKKNIYSQNGEDGIVEKERKQSRCLCSSGKGNTEVYTVD